MSAIAIFSYTATQSDELSITKDEVLTVLDSETTDEGWTCVVGKNGGKGIVPEGYLKLLPATSSESNPKQNVEVTNNNNNNVITANKDEPDDINSHYIAKFSYESTDDDELNLSPGDKLKLLSPPQADGWTHALKISDNTSGMVPLNYIEKDEHYIDHTKDAGNELTNILQRRRRMSDGIGLMMRQPGQPEQPNQTTLESKIETLEIKTLAPTPTTSAPAPKLPTPVAITSIPAPETPTPTPLPLPPSPAKAQIQLERSSTIVNTEKSEQDVIDWLNKIGKDYGKKYGKMLIDDGYDSLHELEDISMDDLVDAGVKKAHARKICAASSSSSASSTSASVSSLSSSLSSINNQNTGDQLANDAATSNQPLSTSTIPMPVINTTSQPMAPAPTRPIPIRPTPIVAPTMNPDLHWVITDDKRQAYEQQYMSLSLPALSTFQQVLPFFQRSGLNDHTLMSILSLADANHDHLLSIGK